MYDCKSRKIQLELDNALVRPQLEDCVHFWSHRYNKDMIALESM